MSSKKAETKKTPGKRRAPVSSIPILRTAAFQKIYATRVLVTRTEFDLRAILSNEKISEGGDEAYVGEAMIILTPTAANELSRQLVSLIESWEKENGAIERRPSESIYSDQRLSP